MPERTNDRRRVRWICWGLAVAVFAVYGPVASHDFVDWDDGAYVYKNPKVYAGLTFEGVAWAFTTFEMGNWHPLTWLSHMLDCELFGLDPGGHHLVNVGLHALAAIALFLALLRMEGSVWPAAWVAALFALHPLRVESVAWAAERKDVLAGFFWMSTLVAYAAYARRGGAFRYGWVLATMALGLMSKAMLVTLPCVLLLLDVWPLKRWTDRAASGRLLLEKLPLVALAAAAGVVAFVAQRSAGAVGSAEALSVVARLQNAAVSYMDYVRQTLWPSGLAYFYPHPMLVGGDGLVAGRIVLAVLGLSGLTVLALAGLRRRPWLAVGWFWFLGTSVPVIGLVQLGMQARADRYTYVPSVGLLLMAAWSAWALRRAPGLRAATAALALLSVVAAGVATTMQLRHWRDSRALAERALSVTTDNFMAHDLLGSEFERDGDLRRAAEEIGTALEINPACNSCRLKLGLVLGNLGYFDRGRELLELTLRLAPGHMAGAIHGGLGAILQRQGDLGAARHHLQRALELEPGLAEARNNLAVVHEAAGRMVEARDELEQTVRSAPRYALAHKNLGGLLLILGDLAGAVRELERAIELEPELLAAHFKLAVVRVNRDELPAAVAGFERVLELDPQHIDAMYNLALVLNAMGRPTEAESYLQRILVLDPQHPDARAVLGDRVPQ